MLKSMTGYGKAIADYKGKTFTVEVKSLNSKFLDLALRLPNGMKEKEMEVRAEIGKMLERGKIELSINTDNSNQKNVSINKELAKAYYDELCALKKELNIESGDILRTIITIPEVLGSAKSQTDEEEVKALTEAIYKAIAACDDFRKQEGALTANEITTRINSIKSLLPEIEKLDAPRLENIKNKLRGSLSDIIFNIFKTRS